MRGEKAGEGREGTVEAVLAVLAVCKGDSCKNPWAVS